MKKGQMNKSQNLADELRKVEVDCNLKNKILITVSDNASNIKKAANDVLKWKLFGCYVNNINLIVRLPLSVVMMFQISCIR